MAKRLTFTLTVSTLLALALSGCAGSLTPGEDDTAQSRLEVPLAQVREAMTQVLTEQGYQVRSSESDGSLRTGYRKEQAGPWDALLNSRLGVGRSRVEALLVEDGQAATRVTVMVRYEGKKWLWELWRTGPPPLQQSAVNQMRLLRNQLRLLDVQIDSDSSPNSMPNRSAIR